MQQLASSSMLQNVGCPYALQDAGHKWHNNICAFFLSVLSSLAGHTLQRPPAVLMHDIHNSTCSGIVLEKHDVSDSSLCFPRKMRLGFHVAAFLGFTSLMFSHIKFVTFDVMKPTLPVVLLFQGKLAPRQPAGLRAPMFSQVKRSLGSKGR